MSRGHGSRTRHHGLGLLLAGGALLAIVTGLGLQHPHWLGRRDPRPAGRGRRSGRFPAAAAGGAGPAGGVAGRRPHLARPAAAAGSGPPGGNGVRPGSVGDVWLLGGDELLRARDGGAVWAPVPLPAGRGLRGSRRCPDGDGRRAAGGGNGLRCLDRQDASGSWRELWRFAPSRGDRLRTGAPPAQGTLGAALAWRGSTLWGRPCSWRVVLSGLLLGWWRRGRRRRRG